MRSKRTRRIAETDHFRRVWKTRSDFLAASTPSLGGGWGHPDAGRRFQLWKVAKIAKATRGRDGTGSGSCAPITSRNPNRRTRSVRPAETARMQLAAGDLARPLV